MENQSNITSSDVNQEMGFVGEEGFVREENNHLKKIPASSLVGGGSWWWQSVKPFVHGGLAGGLDMQLSLVVCELLDRPLAPIFGNNGHKDDFGRLGKSRTSYGGLRAQVLAVTLYRALAFGSYDVLTRKASAQNKRMPLSIYQEACCGLLAGAAEACISSPLHYASLRVQADRNKPTAQRLNYRNAFDAAYRIGVNQGISELWRGGLPYVKIVMAFDMGMLTSYNQSFNYFRASCGYKEETATFAAAAVSSFFGAACCRPFVIITDYMLNEKPGSNGKLPFTSSFDCALKILKVRGLREFYRGFPLHLSKTAPSVVFTWMFLEALRKQEGSAGLEQF